MPAEIHKSEPLIVEVVRGAMVESRHRVHVAVLNADGDVVHGWGDVDKEIYPRSAIKPLQALPLLETGAAGRFRLTDERIALACASHSGAPAHVMAVEAWLGDLGMTGDDLECGAQRPYDDQAADAMIKRGETPCRIHNNCSGKHSGFLTTSKHLGEDRHGYLDIAHPVQKRLYGVLSELGETDMAATGRGVDGCGIPVYGMALKSMALAMAKMANPRGLGETRKSAAERIVHSMAKHNYMVAGRARFDTAAMTAGVNAARRAGSSIFVTKAGAEATHAAILPGQGLGAALKAEDGAKRASDTVMANLLTFLGCLDKPGEGELAGFLAPVLRNWEGVEIGALKLEAGWSAP